MTNMIIYLIGTLLVVAGLAYGASRLGVSQVWIVAGALVIVGLGMMAGIVKTRQKDPAQESRRRTEPIKAESAAARWVMSRKYQKSICTPIRAMRAGRIEAAGENSKLTFSVSTGYALKTLFKSKFTFVCVPPNRRTLPSRRSN